MSLWFFIMLGTAVGGALLVWHDISRTKHVTEEMLGQYREMLAKAREKKAEELAKAEADESEEPEEVAAPGDAVAVEKAD